MPARTSRRPEASRPEDAAGARVLGSWIDALSWDEALERIAGWAARRESRYVCLCNVHSLVTARQRVDFRRVINGADASLCDGMPVAWYLRRHGFPRQQRINGPDLMWKYCERAAATGTGIFLYGATPRTLEKLAARLQRAFPELRLAGVHSPPFRALSPEEERQTLRMIEHSGAGVVFVGLGCPKQELWMARQRGRLPAVMIGVGAAFDYHAGIVKRAPPWMQQRGLEWLYRLACEPRRLWRRYLLTNTLFAYYLARQGVRALINR